MPHHIHGNVITGLLAALVRRGHDEGRLRAAARLPRGARFLRLPFDTLHDLVEAGLAQSDDPHFGLSLCGTLTADQGAPIFLTMLACPDLGSALQRMTRFHRVISDVMRLSLQRDPDGVWVEARLPGPQRPATRHIAEWMMGDFRVFSEMAVGRHVPPVEVHFPWPTPPQPERLEAWFEAPVRFDRAFTGLRLGNPHLATPLRTAHQTFLTLFEAQAEQEAEALPGRCWADRVADVFEASLPRVPELGEVASRLRCSPRTLQRRLGAEGTSLADVLDALRQRLAKERLARGDDIGDVSWGLGYSSATAFHRAFRRWTGETPAVWQRGGQAPEPSAQGDDEAPDAEAEQGEGRPQAG